MNKINLLSSSKENLQKYLYSGIFLFFISIFDVFVNSFFSLNLTSFLPETISFILPLAGFIIGAIYISKEEEHYRRVGRTCLSLGLLSIVIGFLISMIFFAAIISTI